jgi:hypothetical protein
MCNFHALFAKPMLKLNDIRTGSVQAQKFGFIFIKAGAGVLMTLADLGVLL